MSEFQLDTTAFNRVLRELERRGVATMPQLIQAEAGSVLKACFKRTKIAPVEKVDRGSRKISARLVNTRILNNEKGENGISPEAGRGFVVSGTRSSGSSGRVWLRGNWPQRTGKPAFILTHQGGARTGNIVGRRTMATLIQASGQYQGLVRQEIPRGRKTMGLAKQSWLQCATDLGIDLTQVKGGGRMKQADFAMAQNASGRIKAHKNGVGRQMGSGFQYMIVIQNILPYARSIGMDRILKGVLAGRVKQFQRLVTKGYADDMAKLAKAFPNLGLSVSI